MRIESELLQLRTADVMTFKLALDCGKQLLFQADCGSVHPNLPLRWEGRGIELLAVLVAVFDWIAFLSTLEQPFETLNVPLAFSLG